MVNFNILDKLMFQSLIFPMLLCAYCPLLSPQEEEDIWQKTKTDSLLTDESRGCQTELPNCFHRMSLILVPIKYF